MIKYVQCRKCLGKNPPAAEPGYIQKFIMGGDGVTKVEVAEECECHKKWREEVRVEGEAKRSGFNPKWRTFDIYQDYVGDKSLENLKRVETFVNKALFDENETIRKAVLSSSIYIYGPNGTQKTTIGNWIGYQFIRANKKANYILMNDLIKLLQKADREEEAQDKIERLLNVDCLIIDEALDPDKVTLFKSNWQLPFLDTFIRNRINKHKGIIFISNVELDNVNEEKFEKSIKDLVKREVAAQKAELLFEDNYIENKSKVDVESLF